MNDETIPEPEALAWAECQKIMKECRKRRYQQTGPVNSDNTNWGNGDTDHRGMIRPQRDKKP